MLTGART